LEKLDKHIERVKSSVNHLNTILNDFLSVGKLEEGRIDIVKENVSLSAFFTEIKDEVRPVLKEKQQLIIDLRQSEKEFYTDSKILRSALFNLISNASKYSDPGKEIHLIVICKEDKVTIEVQDEGIGIPKPDIKHIFDRFFRASNTSNIQGTGLGLNIVKRYIDLLGGSITFISEEGKGSIFTITLPL
jgi:signal transduction histidine kinase